MTEERAFALDAGAVAEWQSRLDAASQAAAGSILERLLLLRQLLEEITAALVRFEPQTFPTLFDRLVYIEEQTSMPEALQKEIHRLRKTANKAVHESASRHNVDDVLAGIKAIRTYLEFFATSRHRSTPSIRLIGISRRKDTPTNPPDIGEGPTAYPVNRTPNDREETPTVAIPAPPTNTRTTHSCIRAIVVASADVEQLASRDGNLYRRRRIDCRSDEENLEDFSVLLMYEWADMPLPLFTTVNLIRLKQISTELFSTADDSLVVVDPDLLYQPTEIAECFQRNGANPWLFLPGRFMQEPMSEAMLKGVIAGEMFSERLAPTGRDYKKTFLAALRKHSLSTMQFKAGTTAKIRQDLKAQVKTMMEVINTLPCAKDAERSLEPTFIAPAVGLFGRPDALLSSVDRGYHSIELKSGSPAPSILSATLAGQKIPTAAWPNHLVQVGCYHMLLGEIDPSAPRANSILYSADPDDPLRTLSITPLVQKAIMLVRNQLALMEKALAAGRTAILDELSPAQFQGSPLFVLARIERFNSVRCALSPLERSYFDQYTAFVMREYFMARTGSTAESRNIASRSLASLWLEPTAVRCGRFACLRGLAVIRTEPGTVDLKLAAGSDEAADFREGDIVVLHEETEEFEPVAKGLQLWKGVIRTIDLSTRTIEVRLFNSYAQLPSQLKWILDHDFMDSSFKAQWASLQYFAEAPDNRRNLLLGLVPPECGETTDLRGLHSVDSVLTDNQRDLLEHCLASRDYFLLQGPPGTGKTSVMLRGLVQCLSKLDDEVILVVAFTNRAVDEISTKLEGVCDFVRFGSSDRSNEDSRSHFFETWAASMTEEELRQRISQTRVVLTTVTTCSLRPEFFDLWHFTTAIVDEASQLVEPQIIGILARVGRFILIGDEKQLPAVTSQLEAKCAASSPLPKEAGIKDLSESLFGRLLRRCQALGWKHAYGMLEKQRRMHVEIQEFPSRRFYEGKLNPLSIQEQSGPSTLFSAGNGSALEKALAKNRVLLIPSPNPTAPDRKEFGFGRTHRVEAKRVVEILKTFLNAYKRSQQTFDPLSTIGVVTPFRAQVAEIRRQIASAGEGYEKLRSVTVDTVERFQGGERDIIVMSLVVQEPIQLKRIQSLTANGLIDRKLNVALTRAKDYMIILADSEVLLAEEGSDDQFRHYAAMVKYLNEVGAVASPDLLGDSIR